MTVTSSDIVVRKVSQRGARDRDGASIRSGCGSTASADPEFSAESCYLVSRGKKFAIAGFLSPKEKEAFASALQAALNEARRGPTRTVTA